MKLNFEVTGKTQPDPFIFEDDGRFFIYATGELGVDCYEASDPSPPGTTSAECWRWRAEAAFGRLP